MTLPPPQPTDQPPPGLFLERFWKNDLKTPQPPPGADWHVPPDLRDGARSLPTRASPPHPRCRAAVARGCALFGGSLSDTETVAAAAAVLLARSYTSTDEAVEAGFLDMVVPLAELPAAARAEAVRLAALCKGGFGLTKLNQRAAVSAAIRKAGFPAKL